MTPAFAGTRQAGLFVALLGILLAAPWVVAKLDALDRSQVYPTLPVDAGPYAHIHRQVFEEHSDLDVVFVGSSFMLLGIDAPYVQRELSRVLGREAVVTVLASDWPGLDRDYTILRDLLARRHVRLAVLQLPNRNRPTADYAAIVNRVSDQPHVEAFRFFRVGEMPDGDLPLRSEVALYAGAVLGLPRHLLSFVRPNYTERSSVAASLGSRLVARGFYGAPYAVYRPSPPALRADEMIYSAATASTFKFFDEPLPPYQTHFAKLNSALLKEYGVPAVVLHIPQANEIDADVVEERLNWIEEFAIDGSMVGIPPKLLFAGMSGAEVERFFVNDHLNENGAIYFTRAVMPALSRIVGENEEAN
jgi:hypothetical protein